MANTIYVHPQAAADAVIKVGGVCYQRVGPSDRDPSVFYVDEGFDDCDACAVPKKCFEEWVAYYDCDTEEWSGPFANNRVCLPTGTVLDWVKVSGDPSSSTCEYRIYVPYDPEEDCPPNGDCSEVGDSPTPPLPFDGATPPPDCCFPPCGWCTTNPNTVKVTFDVPPAPDYCSGGHCDFGGQKMLSGLMGTYTLIQVEACKWVYNTNGPTMIQYHSPDVGEDECTGPPSRYSGLYIELHLFFQNPDGVMWSLHVDMLDAGAPWFGGNELVPDGDCCAPCTITNTEVHGGCGQAGDGGTATIEPQCS